MEKEIQRKNILIPWVEKFRPKTLKEVVAQDVLVESLSKYLDLGNVLLFIVVCFEDC
jgi:replication-associated recombination protein RarA